jgi:hypothetical protein
MTRLADAAATTTMGIAYSDFGMPVSVKPPNGPVRVLG